MARLDRLAVKEVAQIGAVIGREFSYELLAPPSPCPSGELRGARAARPAELIFRRGAPPEATYIFKHALVQDAAYQSLLKSRRQQLHARIAEVLGSSFPGVGRPQPRAAGASLRRCRCSSDTASRPGREAGLAALPRSAMKEAVPRARAGAEGAGLAPPECRSAVAGSSIGWASSGLG